MISAGQLHVRAEHGAGGQLRNLAVRLQRPSVASLFVGRSPDAVSEMVPRLFTLCAHAQQVAARAAVNAALGREPPDVDHPALWMEFLHENLWRLLLDWPPALGLAPAGEAFITWRKARHDDSVGASVALLGETLRPLARACRERLGGDREIAAVPGWPDLDPRGWLASWQGYAPPGPVVLPPSVFMAYHWRVEAVEAAVRALDQGCLFPVAQAANGGGAAGQVLTARGILTHAVHVVDGQVAGYRVQAPTDAFFADAQPLAGLLADCGFPSLDQARQGMNQAILALDPCLPYTLELHDA